LKGERALFQAFGVLSSNEDINDLAKKYEASENAERQARGRTGTERVDPDNMEAYFPTSIDGVILTKKISTRDGEHQFSSVRLRFSRDALDQFLTEE